MDIAMVEAPPAWDALFIAYRNQTGRWPERVYLHPADYRRERDRDLLIALAVPDAGAPAAVWGVPVQVTPLAHEGDPLLWPPAGMAAAARRAAEDAELRKEQLYPLFPISPLLWAFGNAQGDVTAGIGPYWPDPPFKTEQVPEKTIAWRYVVPPGSQPVMMLAEPPSPWADLDIRVAPLQRWAWADGRQVLTSWWIGFAAEIGTYLLWCDLPGKSYA
jgi:hypothetical protein